MAKVVSENAFNTSFNNAKGEKKSGVIRFTDTPTTVQVYDESLNVNSFCDTSALIAHANGKATPEQIASNSVLAQITSAEAGDYLIDLVKKGYVFITFSEG